MGEGDGDLSNETAFKACRAQCLQPGYLQERSPPPVLEALSNQRLFLNIPKNKGFGEVT